MRIITKYFVAGIVYKYPLRNECAPILKYMACWHLEKIKKYCDYKKFVIEIIEEDF